MDKSKIKTSEFDCFSGDFESKVNTLYPNGVECIENSSWNESGYYSSFFNWWMFPGLLMCVQTPNPNPVHGVDKATKKTIICKSKASHAIVNESCRWRTWEECQSLLQNRSKLPS